MSLMILHISCIWFFPDDGLERGEILGNTTTTTTTTTNNNNNNTNNNMQTDYKRVLLDVRH